MGIVLGIAKIERKKSNKAVVTRIGRTEGI
jgi:hypothetical protein